MFDLAQSIDAWCQAVHRYRMNRVEHVEELKDHLYCKVEALQKGGMTDEQAFKEAIAQMGQVEELAAEHEKNRNFTTRLFDQISNYQERISHMNEKKRARLLIGISIVFAITMMLSSSLIEDGDTSQVVVNILIALWWIPFSILAVGVRRKTRCVKSSN